MGASVSSLVELVRRWFTGTPDEFNPTNESIRIHHENEDGRKTPTSDDAPFPTPEDRDIQVPTSGAHVNVNDTTISLQHSQVQKYLHHALVKGPIQPEVWPTKEEYRLAKERIQYDPEKLHFAVCGDSGAGKSSLVNAFRGLKSNSSQAAPTGVDETTKAITRYPDPRKELPYKRFVWYDCPGAGTLKTPGWQYFNQQGLFIFDVIILVYATRFTEINVSIIQNCERFKIPLFIVRSKSDIDIDNIMRELVEGENDNDSDDNAEDYQTQARQQLIDSTKNNVEKNLKEAGLAEHDVFIVSSHNIFSLVTANFMLKLKGLKKTTPAIDEARLVETILMTAHARRYGNQALLIENDLLTNSDSLPLIGWH